MAFLTVNSVHHTYFTADAATKALEDIQLSIDQGEFVSLLGASGCGKTTLLSILAGLISPTAGIVTIDGQTVTSHTNSSIGYMLQQDYLFPWKTVEENVMLGLKLAHHELQDARKIAVQLLQDVGLPSIGEKYPRELSGGMKQRVALARTLAVNPKILLLDEPFSALDYKSKLQLENLLSKMLEFYDKTAVLVTHDIGEAIAMSDRIYLLSPKPGRIHKIFEVPNELRELTPFDARSHPSYSALFQKIWKELEQIEHEPPL